MMPNFLSELENYANICKEKSKQEQIKENREYLILHLEDALKRANETCKHEYKNLMEGFREHAEHEKEKERILSILKELKEEKSNDN